MSFRTNIKIKDLSFRINQSYKEYLFFIFLFLKELNPTKKSLSFFWLGKTFFKNYCLHSIKSKAVIGKYKMNKYILRRKILSKEIIGFKKAIW
jgi:ribosomal protein S14